MALFIDVPIRVTLKQAVFLGRNDCFRLIIFDEPENLVGVIATVSQDRIKIKAL